MRMSLKKKRQVLRLLDWLIVSHTANEELWQLSTCKGKPIPLHLAWKRVVRNGDLNYFYNSKTNKYIWQELK